MDKTIKQIVDEIFENVADFETLFYNIGENQTKQIKKQWYNIITNIMDSEIKEKEQLEKTLSEALKAVDYWKEKYKNK